MDDNGPELAEFRAHPDQLEKSKRVLRRLFGDPSFELRDLVPHIPVRPDRSVTKNWLFGYDPNDNLVLTIKLKTGLVELVEA